MDNNISEMPLPATENTSSSSNATQPSTGPNGMPMVQQVQAPASNKSNHSSLIMTLIIIVLALLSLSFIGLFIWKQIELTDAETSIQEQIDIAVAAAKDEQATKLEAIFLEREKYPFKSFSGPVDYGQLSFEYPRTWSVYVANPATNGGSFEAYFNPNQVEAVSNNTINALRVTIQNKNYEDVVAQYQRSVDSKEHSLDVQVITVNDATANRYTGTIPGTEFQGIIVIFKIRDKTATLQTDSMLFEADFNKLLETISFNA